MHRHFQLKLQIAVLLLQVISSSRLTGGTVSEQLSFQKAAAAPKHGSLEILHDKLIRVRELEGFLKSAVPDGEGQLSGAAKQSLQQIFAHSHDVFESEVPTGYARSIRAAALRILRNSSPAAQRDWVQSMSILADGRLHDAVISADRAALDAVARQFPMTEPGITAAILSITKELLHGANADVGARLALLESEYSGTVLESFLRQRSRPLKQQLQAATERQPANAATSNQQVTKLSITTAFETGTLAPPWPKPKWEWRESVWNYPGAPQPEAGTVLESFVPGFRFLRNHLRRLPQSFFRPTRP